MGLIVDEAVNITRDCKAKWKVRRGKRGTQQKQEVNGQPRIFPKRSQTNQASRQMGNTSRKKLK